MLTLPTCASICYVLTAAVYASQNNIKTVKFQIVRLIRVLVEVRKAAAAAAAAAADGDAAAAARSC